MPVVNTYFEVDGLTLSDRVDIISGTVDPRAGVGTDARMGSMYLRSNGETWKKIGIGTQDWAISTDSGGSGTPIDGSLYVTKTRSIQIEDDYLVETDVGTVSFNHYYEDGVICSLNAPTTYNHTITIKNLSGQPIEIKPLVGRIDGARKHVISNKFSAITLSPLVNDWIITSLVEGKKYVLVN